MRRILLSIVMIIAVFTASSQFVVNFKAEKLKGCDSLTVQFRDLTTATGLEAWLWSFGDNTFSEERHPIHHYATPGDYTVQLTILRSSGSNLQTQSLTKEHYIVVNALPDTSHSTKIAMYNASFCVGFFGLSNAVSLDYSYTWHFGDGDTTVGSAVLHTYASSGFYIFNMKVKNNEGCEGAVTDTINLVEFFSVPNVFSPNGDGLNDEFAISSDGNQLFKLQIFCRWGNLVYETTAKNVRWDGRNSVGMLMIPGTYYYNLTSVGGSNSIKKAGFVELAH